MRTYYFVMKFLRSFFIGFCSAAAILAVAAAAAMLLYRIYL